MQYRRLGRTELMVAEVGLGVRSSAGIAPEAATEIVRAALDAGVSLIELAASDLAAAVAVGHAIDRRRPHLVLVVSGDANADSLEATIARMATDSVDCYLLDLDRLDTHGVDEAWAKLEVLRERGLARFLGVTARSAVATLGVVEDGRTEVVQASHNLLGAGAVESVIAAAAGADVGLLACSPLAGGRLTSGEQGAGLAFLAQGDPRTLAQAAIAWALSDARVSAVVAGARTPEQAVENAEASRVAPLPRVVLERVAGGEGATGSSA